MKKHSILLPISALLFTIFYSSFTYAGEPTGDIYWTLNSELRLQYISPCRSVYTSDYPEKSEGNSITSAISELINKDDKRHVVQCSKRKFKIIFRLREDGELPNSYPYKLTLYNNKRMYVGEFNKYNKTLSPLNTRDNIILSINSPANPNPYDTINYPYNKHKINTEIKIDTSNLNKLDELRKKELQEYTDNLNLEAKNNRIFSW